MGNAESTISSCPHEQKGFGRVRKPSLIRSDSQQTAYYNQEQADSTAIRNTNMPHVWYSERAVANHQSKPSFTDFSQLSQIKPENSSPAGNGINTKTPYPPTTSRENEIKNQLPQSRPKVFPLTSSPGLSSSERLLNISNTEKNGSLGLGVTVSAAKVAHQENRISKDYSRRRQFNIPGIAKKSRRRQPEQNKHNESGSLNRPNRPKDLRKSRSDPRFLSCGSNRYSTFRGISPRTEDYSQLGKLKFGSLRVVNGYASPSTPYYKRVSQLDSGDAVTDAERDSGFKDLIGQIENSFPSERPPPTPSKPQSTLLQRRSSSVYIDEADLSRDGGETSPIPLIQSSQSDRTTSSSQQQSVSWFNSTPSSSPISSPSTDNFDAGRPTTPHSNQRIPIIITRSKSDEFEEKHFDDDGFHIPLCLDSPVIPGYLPLGSYFHKTENKEVQGWDTPSNPYTSFYPSNNVDNSYSSSRPLTRKGPDDATQSSPDRGGYVFSPETTPQNHPQGDGSQPQKLEPKAVESTTSAVAHEDKEVVDAAAYWASETSKNYDSPIEQFATMNVSQNHPRPSSLQFTYLRPDVYKEPERELSIEEKQQLGSPHTRTISDPIPSCKNNKNKPLPPLPPADDTKNTETKNNTAISRLDSMIFFNGSGKDDKIHNSVNRYQGNILDSLPPNSNLGLGIIPQEMDAGYSTLEVVTHPRATPSPLGKSYRNSPAPSSAKLRGTFYSLFPNDGGLAKHNRSPSTPGSGSDYHRFKPSSTRYPSSTSVPATPMGASSRSSKAQSGKSVEINDQIGCLNNIKSYI